MATNANACEEPTMTVHERLPITRPTEGTAVVTIDRAEKLNAMSLDMWVGLGETFEALGQESALRAIILTGAGRAFCSGADISEFAKVRATPEQARHYAHMVDVATLAIMRCPKATFAAVSGVCYGGGCGLALGCDFRIADETAAFSIPAAKLGIVYGIEETRALYLTVGFVAAKRMLFTGARFDAAESLAMGLATEVSGGTALGAALERAEELSRSAPLSLAGTKAVLEALAVGETPERVVAAEAATARAMASDDYREGRAAFAEKRKPHFKGC